MPSRDSFGSRSRRAGSYTRPYRVGSTSSSRTSSTAFRRSSRAPSVQSSVSTANDLYKQRMRNRRVQIVVDDNNIPIEVRRDPVHDVQDEEQRQAEEDALDEVIMALDFRDRNTIGCCCYVARDATLHFMEDVKLGSVDIIDQLKLMIEPTIVLVPSRISEEVLKHIDPHYGSGGSAEDAESVATFGGQLIHLCHSGDFNYEAAITKLVSLNIETEHGPTVRFIVPGDVLPESDESDARRQERLLRFGGWVNLDSRLSVACSGAVLNYLQRKRSSTFLPGDRAAQLYFPISHIEMFSLADNMFVNDDTLSSLQILQSDFHPNRHNHGPAQTSMGSKEGLSVYGLFHHLARTPQGKTLLKQYFLRPSLRIDVMKERLNVISTLLRTDNGEHLDQLARSMRYIKNMKPAMTNLRKGAASNAASANGLANRTALWKSIQLFIYHCLQIKDIWQQIEGAHRLKLYHKIDQRFNTAQLGQVGRQIGDTIDFPESEVEDRTVVMPHVDPELDHLKHTYQGLDSMLSTIGQDIAREIPATFQPTLNVLYFPQIGYLVAVHKSPEYGNNNAVDTQGTSWHKVFETGKAEYYKNAQMRELDSQFGDIWSLISAREIEILHQLAVEVLRYEDLLVSLSDICGELDSMIALAQGARLFRLSKPRLTEENVIKIHGGRHILQELTVGAYVANDTHLKGSSVEENPNRDPDVLDATQTTAPIPLDKDSGDPPHMQILTGPNYSGKSVYLKQVAIIVYMAHIGSFVPAERAKIGITDKILTRINTRESVATNQSAFMIDLQQVSLALRLATPRSLLLLDEFGKGTDATDGAALACGVLEYLHALGNSCPKVLAATHFHEIFDLGYLRSSAILAHAHMAVRIDEELLAREDQLTYLYNLERGRSKSSYGTICAATNGISAEIVDRAEDLLRLDVKGPALVEACAILPGNELIELEGAEQLARDFISADKTQLHGGLEFLNEILEASNTAYSHPTTGVDNEATETGPYDTSRETAVQSYRSNLGYN